MIHPDQQDDGYQGGRGGHNSKPPEESESDDGVGGGEGEEVESYVKDIDLSEGDREKSSSSDKIEAEESRSMMVPAGFGARRWYRWVHRIKRSPLHS